ncbi:MAG: hypothetical protein HZB14_01145 [Actinobacteria bacterium]|nr:hypothetical protein [Actinomycetota bacterium]
MGDERIEEVPREPFEEPRREPPGQRTQEFRARRMDEARRRQLEPDRRCPDCGAKLTVQIFPHGYEAHCTPCERRARFAAADSRRHEANQTDSAERR